MANAIRWHRSESCSLLRDIAEQLPDAAIHRTSDLRAAADDQYIRPARFFKRARRLERDAVAGAHWHAIGRKDRPSIVLRAVDAIRHAQHLDRARERDRRKAGQREKAKMRKARQRQSIRG